LERGGEIEIDREERLASLLLNAEHRSRETSQKLYVCIALARQDFKLGMAPILSLKQEA